MWQVASSRVRTGTPGSAAGAGDCCTAHATGGFAGDGCPGSTTIRAAVNIVRAASVIGDTNINSLRWAATSAGRRVKGYPHDANGVTGIATAVVGIFGEGASIGEVVYFAPGDAIVGASPQAVATACAEIKD